MQLKHQTNPTIKMSKYLLWTGFFLIIIDQISKKLTSIYLPLINSSNYLYPYGGIGIFRDFLGIEFSINHITNFGAAWGIFSNYQYELMVLRILLIIGLIIYLFKYNNESSWNIPLILIISGALSNVLDYFLYGHVIDMFHVVLWGYDFPVFNLADAFISTGIGLLFLISLIKPLTNHDSSTYSH
ncbi:MAG: signal peptidase II [Parachlamydiaceae bacterium]|nr:signal peptidase II [Parachlamydiaceae bacterium]